MMEKTEKARYLIISNSAVGIGAAEGIRDKLTIAGEDRVGVN
jgi:hypothetical protein